MFTNNMNINFSVFSMSMINKVNDKICGQDVIIKYLSGKSVIHMQISEQRM